MLHTFGIYVLDIHKVMMSIFKSLFFLLSQMIINLVAIADWPCFQAYGFWLHEERPQGLVFEVT